MAWRARGHWAPRAHWVVVSALLGNLCAAGMVAKFAFSSTAHHPCRRPRPSLCLPATLLQVHVFLVPFFDYDFCCSIASNSLLDAYCTGPISVLGAGFSQWAHNLILCSQSWRYESTSAQAHRARRADTEVCLFVFACQGLTDEQPACPRGS